MPKYPCRGCIHFKVCGENTRTKSCSGRITKRQLLSKDEVREPLRNHVKGEDPKEELEKQLVRDIESLKHFINDSITKLKGLEKDLAILRNQKEDK